MAIQVKHSKVSTIPDTDDTSLVRPSDWNADHVLTGTIPVANGGTGADNPTDARTNLSAAKSGANSDITSMTGVTGGISSPDYIQFDTTYATTLTTGQLGWDGNNTLGLGMSGGNVIQQIGLQTFIYGKASSAITKGQLIKKTGANGSSGVITFAPTTANMTNSTDIIGIAAEDIALNGFGYIMSTGNLRGFNTTGASSGETWADGDTLYYNPAGNGLMTKTKPSAPNSKTEVAVVTNAGSGGSGSVVVEIIHGTQLGGTDSNVQLTSVNNGNILSYDGGNGYWKNTDLTAGTGISISKSANGLLTVTNSSPNTYDPSNVAITGGTINGTSIGATTPAAGTFTTITGQTEVLRGTGQNFLTNSTSFATTWTNTAGTLTSSQSDPFGGSSAFLLVPTVANTSHWLFSGTYGIATSPYTLSVYVKASGYNLVYLSDVGNGVYSCSYNLSTVTATPNIGCTGTITAVSGATGWYRITLTTTATISTNSRFTITGYPVGATLGVFGASFAGDGTSGIVIYGAQAEFGSTANTYIPTTTTAVYGTPTLSFSGVSTIGLQSDGSLYVSPAGTGAIQAQATTSTTAGGNARGANAVDWQTSRSAAGQVASGTGAIIGGGNNNTASAVYSTVIGGQSNTANGTISTVGGYANTASGYFSGVLSGSTNTAAGYLNFVGGGQLNSGTSASAVTTQSATMNATTAVTLSGSNANIKVGQLVTGTFLGFPNYVAAISGTSLTLASAATGSGTSTLSFFTPHGVVVGGGNNQATGAYSFIGGGGDAGTSANRNVASGDWSVVCGGLSNTASGIGAFVGGGGVTTITGISPNTSSGFSSVVCGGVGNTANTTYAFIGAGANNTANGTGSSVLSGYRGTTRSIQGNTVLPSSVNPISASTGINQTALLVLARETTDATPTVLASNSSAAGTTNQVILPNNSAYYFKIEVIAGVTGAGNTKAWELKGAIKRGANAASTTLVGVVTSTIIAADAGAATWTAVATADTTNGGIALTVTGQASTTIRWVARVTTTEMTF